jgi:quinolinate synthase
MNSDAMIKAFCGRNGGAVCTSSNTGDAFRWAFRQREKIFFFPGQHLGRNTCNQNGIKPEEIIVWKPGNPLGGNTKEDIQRSKVILWDAYCLVHTRFTVDHIRQMRDKHPGAKIVVHPECTEDVVNAADAVGSTSFIVKFVDQASPDSTILIGTEINLTQRLNDETPDKTVLPLHHSLCPNMYKINLENLLYTLEHIGTYNKIEVEDDIKKDARKALDRMLTLSDPSN